MAAIWICQVRFIKMASINHVDNFWTFFHPFPLYGPFYYITIFGHMVYEWPLLFNFLFLYSSKITNFNEIDTILLFSATKQHAPINLTRGLESPETNEQFLWLTVRVVDVHWTINVQGWNHVLLLHYRTLGNFWRTKH